MTGGPCLVLIEGTFADVWAEEVTGTYYAVLAMAAYVGAGAGMTFFLPASFHRYSSANPGTHSCRTLDRRLRFCIHELAMDSMDHHHACSRSIPLRHRHARDISPTCPETPGETGWTATTEASTRWERDIPPGHVQNYGADAPANALRRTGRGPRVAVPWFQLRRHLRLLHRCPSRLTESIQLLHPAGRPRFYRGHRRLYTSFHNFHHY